MSEPARTVLAEDWLSSTDADFSAVAALLGRVPQGRFQVALRDAEGRPRVIRNEPILASGRPMPTLYWLVSASDRVLVGRLESQGAIDQVEAAVDPVALVAAHEAYRRERDALIPSGYVGHRPSAGVGGTRVGVKCLHAHYAYFLAGGNDPVGRWVAEQLKPDDSAPCD